MLDPEPMKAINGHVRQNPDSQNLGGVRLTCGSVN